MNEVQYRLLIFRLLYAQSHKVPLVICISCYLPDLPLLVPDQGLHRSQDTSLEPDLSTGPCYLSEYLADIADYPCAGVVGVSEEFLAHENQLVVHLILDVGEVDVQDGEAD